MNINIQTQYCIGEKVFVDLKDRTNIGIVTGITYHINGDVRDTVRRIKDCIYYRVRIFGGEVKVRGNQLSSGNGYLIGDNW